MRLLKWLLALALPVLTTLVIGLPRHRATVWAQLPPPNPLTAPQPPPRAPAQLQPPVQPQGLPSLVVVAPLPTSHPTPAARVFNCSCFGPGNPTHWMGQVTAPSYFGARQAATGACLAFEREPASPFRPSSGQALAPALTLPQGFQQPNAGRTVASTLPGTINFTTPAQLRSCAQCTCD